jgi:hypothetical protein
MKFKLLEIDNRNALFAFAFGEFILIVVGILFALQIDNWNENRKVRKSELHYLDALQEEFSDNLNSLYRVMQLNKRNTNLAFELSKYTGPLEPVLSANEVDSLILFTHAEVQYRPGSGVLVEVISSGKLELLSKDQLRYEIASLESVMQAVRFQEQEHSRIRYILLNMLNDEGNTRRATERLDSETFGLTPSKFESTNLRFLKSERFDNYLVVFYVTAKILNDDYYPRLENKIKSILALIEDELN